MCPLLYPKNTQAYLWNLFKSENVKDRWCPEVSVALLLFLFIFCHWAPKCQHDESIYSCSHCTPPFSGCAQITSCRLKLLPINYLEFSSRNQVVLNFSEQSVLSPLPSTMWPIFIVFGLCICIQGTSALTTDILLVPSQLSDSVSLKPNHICCKAKWQNSESHASCSRGGDTHCGLYPELRHHLSVHQKEGCT